MHIAPDHEALELEAPPRPAAGPFCTRCARCADPRYAAEFFLSKFSVVGLMDIYRPCIKARAEEYWQQRAEPKKQAEAIAQHTPDPVPITTKASRGKSTVGGGAVARVGSR